MYDIHYLTKLKLLFKYEASKRPFYKLSYRKKYTIKGRNLKQFKCIMYASFCELQQWMFY